MQFFFKNHEYDVRRTQHRVNYNEKLHVLAYTQHTNATTDTSQHKLPTIGAHST
jgi:hypothetical protein